MSEEDDYGLSPTKEVVEIDPEVTKIATDYLGLGARTRIVTYNEDTRTKLQQLDEGKYEMVMRTLSMMCLCRTT